MAYNNGPKAFEVGTGGVTACTLVKLDGGKVVANTVADTDDPIGAALSHVAEGKDVSVRFLNMPGTMELKAAGAIALDADVYAADGGEIQALPVAAGTYRKIGKAIKAASGAGSIIEVLPYDYHATTTVS